MKRSDFIKYLISTPLFGIGLKHLSAMSANLNSSDKMPVMFIGHGNPMNAIQDNDITRNWQQMGEFIQPKAILCISAHWETRGTYVTMTPKPKMIYDIGGFPPEMYQLQYPAPGSPKFANDVIEQVRNYSVLEDHEWGLDHGTWSVLIKMFPDAGIPVFQLSLNRTMKPEDHYKLAKELTFLRKKGVLILGSGNIVHNLRHAKWDSDQPYDWAVQFDEQVKQLISNRNHSMLIKSEQINREAQLSIPTREHYMPMLYALALQEENEKVTFFNEEVKMGSMSMRSFVIS